LKKSEKAVLLRRPDRTWIVAAVLIALIGVLVSQLSGHHLSNIVAPEAPAVRD
jgi:hypothetical protein